MVTRFKVIKDDAALDANRKIARTIVEDFKREFLYECAAFVVTRSPVDTGTYMTSHQINPGREGRTSLKSSRGEERGQDWQEFANQALDKLAADIESIDLKNVKDISISNFALHAPEVEYEHGYGVYTALRGAAKSLAQKAAQDAKMSAKAKRR